MNEESAYKSVNVHPLANLHNLDVVQVLTSRAGSAAVEPAARSSPRCRPARAAKPRRRANSSPRPEAADERRTPRRALLARVAVLSVVVVFFQIGVVSEVPVFGVNADLSPLLVAFVGLLCGSTLGAVTGFAVGPARRPGAACRRSG